MSELPQEASYAAAEKPGGSAALRTAARRRTLPQAVLHLIGRLRYGGRGIDLNPEIE